MLAEDESSKQRSKHGEYQIVNLSYLMQSITSLVSL